MKRSPAELNARLVGAWREAFVASPPSPVYSSVLELLPATIEVMPVIESIWQSQQL